MLTFRSSKIIYYGPHSCSNCGSNIVKMGIEFGGNMFDQPEGPIYPNTEWHVHVCDPKRVAQKPRPTGAQIPSGIIAENQIIGASICGSSPGPITGGTGKAFRIPPMTRPIQSPE